MEKRILLVSVVLALVAVLVVPTAASAGNPATGTTDVSGEIAVGYTITPPAAITLGTFNPAGDYEATDKSISVSTTDPNMTKCGITVKDAKTITTGYLTLAGADDASKKLTNSLGVKGGAQSNYTPLTSQVSLRAPNASLESASITDFAVKQTIASGDLAKTAGTYKLTMTFTATFSNS